MPTIVGIFIFISRENFMLSWVEHEKSFITWRPEQVHFTGDVTKKCWLNSKKCRSKFLIRCYFQSKSIDNFLISPGNICCGYLLEAPGRGTFNEYQQHMFLWRNKKNTYLIPMRSDALFCGTLFVCVEVLWPSQPNGIMSSTVS